MPHRLSASGRARRLTFSGAFVVLALVASALLPAPVRAQFTVPTGFTDSLIAGGLDYPVGIAFLPDGRLLIAEQISGRIKLLVKYSLRPFPLVTVDSLNTGYGEQGLLGIAVDPDWPTRPYFYVHYTYRPTKNIRISRFTVTGDLSYTQFGELACDPASRYDVMTSLPDTSILHNGGTLRFGPDKKLYVSLGDDGADCVAQRDTVLAGKILRLDVSHLPAGPGGPATLASITPVDNPFVANPDPRARLVWAKGLRNPARFHIDPSTGRVLITDVGETAWEEVDDASSAGLNFGWPMREGPAEFPIVCAGVDTATFRAPVYSYQRPVPEQPVAVMSGSVYRRPAGASNPFALEYDGDYFITDYYLGWLRRLKRSGTTWSIAPQVLGQANPLNWATGNEAVSDMLVAPNGALYYCRQYTGAFALGTGMIRQIYAGTLLDVSPGRVAADGVRFQPAVPMPSHGIVRLTFDLPRDAPVELGLFDLHGRRVRALLAPSRLGAGEHVVRWDGRDDAGSAISPGVYFARLVVDRTLHEQRVALVR